VFFGFVSRRIRRHGGGEKRGRTASHVPGGWRGPRGYRGSRSLRLTFGLVRRSGRLLLIGGHAGR
jgi:hypothetical protein